MPVKLSSYERRLYAAGTEPSSGETNDRTSVSGPNDYCTRKQNEGPVWRTPVASPTRGVAICEVTAPPPPVATFKAYEKVYRTTNPAITGEIDRVNQWADLVYPKIESKSSQEDLEIIPMNTFFLAFPSERHKLDHACYFAPAPARRSVPLHRLPDNDSDGNPPFPELSGSARTGATTRYDAFTKQQRSESVEEEEPEIETILDRFAMPPLRSRRLSARRYPKSMD